MNWVAIRMLTGDRVKFFGLIFGVTFATFLMSQQVSSSWSPGQIGRKRAYSWSVERASKLSLHEGAIEEAQFEVQDVGCHDSGGAITRRQNVGPFKPGV